MSADPIDPKHSIVVYAKGTLCQDGKVDGAAFKRRQIDDDGLSVNWLECFGGSRSDQIAEVSKLARLILKPSGRYAEVMVKEAEEAVAQHVSAFGAVKNPLGAEDHYEADPSHGLFLGLPEFGHELAQMVGDMIAVRVCALHPPHIKAKPASAQPLV